MAELTLRQLRKSYGKVDVIHGVDLDVADGEFTVFVGPSGCGKSTLLRMIAGLEEISGGEIAIGGARVNEKGPAERGIAMVFQSYALYPHKTVAGNMGFALKHAGVPAREVEAKVQAAAEVLNLTPLLDRLPKALSGGQRQRVAIGRAIVREPKVFLFDEPLSNLDAALRAQMRVEILKLHKRLGATMVYVTHDQVEAMTLADRIVVLQAGRIEQVGAPMDLYNAPANLFVAEFIGSPKMNILDGVWSDGGAQIGGAHVPVSLNSPPHSGAEIKLGVRPEHLRLIDPAQASLRGAILVSERLGGQTLAHVSLQGGDTAIVALDGAQNPQAGEKVGIAPNAGSALHIFDAKSGRRLT